MWNVNGGRPHTVNIDYVTLLARVLVYPRTNRAC
ncbi:MAG: hypothetical protein QG601_1703 [Pseudomonadota bacterium]|jgi:hypothetical protein|nr:hypothetical protein [Pseudomonadota bacterium]MDQ1310433.1 hypothetical protein [Pseudomonadota bacterium]